MAQENELMRVAHGPWHEWGQILPQDEGPHHAVGNEHPIPEYTEKLCTDDTKNTMEARNTDDRTTFLDCCTDHMSSFIKERALQDTLRGLREVNASAKNGLSVDVALGLPALREEGRNLL